MHKNTTIIITHHPRDWVDSETLAAHYGKHIIVHDWTPGKINKRPPVFCKDCKFYTEMIKDPDECNHPKISSVDLVRGPYSGKPCCNTGSPSGHCRISGKLFSAREK